MKYVDGALNLTPSEASYTWSLLPNSIPELQTIKEQITMGQLEWAASILPEEFTSKVAGSSSYAWSIGNAEQQWDPSEGENEVIRILNFDSRHFSTLKRLAANFISWNEADLLLSYKQPRNDSREQENTYIEDPYMVREELQRQIIIGRSVIAAFEKFIA
ncbi:MAG: hypothetical protein NVS1B7_7720 [Candidatus Saccharimonadales bacterium]